MHRRGAPMVLGFGLVLLLLTAGCTSGGPSYIKTKFRDADQRISQTVDGGFREYWDIVVPAGTPALTVRAAVRADQGVSFGLRNPAGRLTTNFAFPATVEVPELSWIEALRPQQGTWRLGLDCARHCDFSFGFYLQDGLKGEKPEARNYRDATVRFVEESAGQSNRQNQFKVPSEASNLTLRITMSSLDAVGLRILDPEGHRRAYLSFPSRAIVDDAAYLVMQDPPQGMWTFRADCRAGCSYNVGAYVH